MTSHLHTIVNAQKHGKAAGITSICSANPFVLRAALEHARNNNRFICIESTGRQVNQDGGYAGMTPDHLVFHKLMRILDRYAKSCGDL